MVAAPTTANAQYSAPVYSGGTATWPVLTEPYSTRSTPFAGYGGGGPGDSTCSGQITATFNWLGSPTAISDNVIVVQKGYAMWQGNNQPINPTGSANDGLNDPEIDSVITQVPNNLYLYTGVSEGTHYSTQKPSSNGTVTLTCTPAVSISQNGAAESVVDYSASVIPVNIAVAGATMNNGVAEILPGQVCYATLQLPAGYTCSTCNWSLSGNYYSNWPETNASAPPPTTIPKSELSITYSPPASSSTTPTWYWDDTESSALETVSCSANVIAPDGTQFTGTFTKNVKEVAPTSSMKATVGSSEIGLNPYGPSNPGYWIYLGGGSNPKGGYVLKYAITQSNDFAGTGESAIAQLANLNIGYTPPPSPPSITGLDASFPYGIGGHGIANGTTTTMTDAPGVLCNNMYTQISVTDNFEDYLMYLPPSDSVGSSVWVPLRNLFWSWSATGTEPAGGWNDSATITGSPTAHKSALTTNYPTWVSFIPAH